MKCVNIPETTDSVVSPAIVHDTASKFFFFLFLVVKVAKSLKVGGDHSVCFSQIFYTVSFSSVFSKQ